MVPVTAPVPGEESARLLARTAAPVNYLDLCAVSLPLALPGAGLPIGLQVIGQGGAESRLLAVAQAVEAELGRPDRLRSVA